MSARQGGVTARIVETFVDSRLTPLLLGASLLAGVAGLLLTPREEEPQIVVPLVDVLVSMPGATPQEIERAAVIELEKLVWGLPGIEHVYSRADEGSALVSLRFRVGHDRERALVDTFTRIQANADRVPPGVDGWIVRPVDIDDVPILTIALSGRGASGEALRRIAEELADRIEAVDDVSLSEVVGGEARAIEVLLDPDRLAARRLTPLEVTRAIGGAHAQRSAGVLRAGEEALALSAGRFLRGAGDLEAVVVALRDGRPVRLDEVALVRDGALEPASYCRIGFGSAAALAGVLPEGAAIGEERPAATLAVSKRKGSNAVRVAERVLERLERARGSILPEGIDATVTRNDGATADEKVNELVGHIGAAVVTVVLVLMLGLGLREAAVVAIAIPVTFAVALFLDLVTGYTINRVTLFALVLSLGLLVDDPIVDVENIHRHLERGGGRSRREVIVEAVNEVRPPLILATLTVIVAFLPMFFITGMMGPYMAPMPFNITAVMLASLVVALTITPWASLRLLKAPPAAKHVEPLDTRTGRTYSALMKPLLRSGRLAALFLLVVAGLFAGAVALPMTGAVPLKMLPFANKDLLQVVVDLPEGSSLERTDAALRELAAALYEEPDVAFVASHAGSPSPHDFQGLVRHHFLRRGDHLGDLRVGLLEKDRREQASHSVALRLRPRLEEIARRHGASIQIAEVPPGPPVLQTLVAEVRAPATATWEDQLEVARDVRERLAAVPRVVDVDWMVSDAPPRPALAVDAELAALHGVSVDEVVRTLALLVGDEPVAALQDPGERRPVPVVARLAREHRSRAEDLGAVALRFGPDGEPLALAQLVREQRPLLPRSITRKDLERVVFVTADVAGIGPADAVLELQASLADDPLPPEYEVELGGEGEWKITLDVFRDLGLAFGAALLGIYVILVGQTRSLALPLVMMVAIPITAIGIFPGFWLINALRAGRVGDYADPTFFTATAMIGMIALAGIVVRNSVILVDFIEMRRGEGLAIEQAVLEAGAVRFRPILLTALTSLLGVWVMTLDPIFSGLAWSFIFGILASTGFTLLVVPLIHHRLHRRETRSA